MKIDIEKIKSLIANNWLTESEKIIADEILRMKTDEVILSMFSNPWVTTDRFKSFYRNLNTKNIEWYSNRTINSKTKTKLSLLPNATEEQLEIVSELKNNNVFVDSVPGSGKTTTAFHIAEKYEKKNILLLTYNRKLSDETKKRLAVNNIKNMKVFTIHGFAQWFFGVSIFDDITLARHLNDKSKPINFDIIIIDEAQDLNPIYFQFITKAISRNAADERLCVIGDKNQSIYDFATADSRYLTLANKIIINNRQWIFKELTYSQRVPKSISNFMNNELVTKKNILVPDNNVEGTIKRIFSNPYSDKVINKIREVIDEYGPENVFVLSPSVKSQNGPAKIISNKLADLGYLCFIPTYDTEDIKPIDLENKVSFLSFHQSKGLERKNVFVLGMDTSYPKYFSDSIDFSVLNNEFYVALTRAKENLYVVTSPEYDPLEFDILRNPKKFTPEQVDGIVHEGTKPISEMGKFISSNNLIKIYEMFKINENSYYEIDSRNIPTRIEINRNGSSYTENVSKINGALITLQRILKTKAGRKELLKDIGNSFKEYGKNFFFDGFSSLVENSKKILKSKVPLTVQNKLFVSNIWNSLVNLSSVTSNQINIENYDWMTEEDLLYIEKSFDIVVPKNSRLEVPTNFQYLDPKTKKIINYIGSVDCIDDENKIIHEAKFVNSFSIEHYVQLMMYKFSLWKSNPMYEDYKMQLTNYKTGESYFIECDMNSLIKIYKILITSDTPKEITSVDFIRGNKTIIKKELPEIKIKKEIEIKYSHKELMKNIVLKNDNKFVIIDFETVNIYYGISQVGIYVIENDEIVMKINEYFKPNPFIFDETINRVRKPGEEYSIHEIRSLKKLLGTKVSFEKYFKKIEKYFNGDYIVIAHNAGFDISTVLSRKIGKGPSFVFADSWYIFKKMIPNQESYKLNDLAKIYNINFNHHDANEDVRAVFEIFKANNTSIKDAILENISKGGNIKIYSNGNILKSKSEHFEYFKSLE